MYPLSAGPKPVLVGVTALRARYLPAASKGLAAALLALLDPNVLWDIGFQLSVVGTAGVISWAGPLRRWLQDRPVLGHRLLAAPVETLAATGAALVLVLPLSLYYFNTLSLVAPVANVLLAPAVPPAMLAGLAATGVSLLSVPLGQLVALLAWPWTAWLLGGTHLLARLPYASLDVPTISIGWLVLWYGVVAALAWWNRWRTTRSP